MAWITPVTNRQTGMSRMTYQDMNRITGNIDYVYDVIADLGYTIIGGRVPKTSWFRDDIIDNINWNQTKGVLLNLYDAIGETPADYPGASMSYSNINIIESLTLYLYNFAFADYLATGEGVYITTESDEQILAS